MYEKRAPHHHIKLSGGSQVQAPKRALYVEYIRIFDLVKKKKKKNTMEGISYELTIDKDLDFMLVFAK